MRYFKNHFGMVISIINSIVISFVMAIAAIFVAHLDFSIPQIIKNWGASFLVIIIANMILPITEWAEAFCGKVGTKRGSLAHGLLHSAFTSFFFNLFATCVLVAINIYDNPEIERAFAGGHLPFKSIHEMYLVDIMRDLPVMYVISFLTSFIVTKFAVSIAINSMGKKPPMPPSGPPETH